MNKNINEHLENQSEEFLKVCFDELEEFRKTGVLSEGEVKKLNKKFFQSNATSLFIIGELIYREISVRHFTKKTKENE